MKKHNPELTYNSRELRKNQTPQEKKLWYDFLRNYPVNFLRQKVIDNYIVDFYCSKAKLVIEIDGEYHKFTGNSEAIRTNNIEKYGLLVLRITNDYIDNSFDECCQYIDSIVKNRMSNY
ncbi:MAG: endonuclease domain-containing protein [Eubacterium sp.]|nr:endonuclease domain-containing protein [Eubacterium sp.]